MKELPQECPKCGLDNISVGTSDNEVVVCVCKCLHSWEAGVLSDYGLSLSSVLAEAGEREEIKRKRMDSAVTRLNSVLGLVTLISALPPPVDVSRDGPGGGGKKTRNKKIKNKNSKGRKRRGRR